MKHVTSPMGGLVTSIILSPKGEALKDGLKNPHLKEGIEVIVKTDKKDGKEVASEVKLAPKK